MFNTYSLTYSCSCGQEPPVTAASLAALQRDCPKAVFHRAGQSQGECRCLCLSVRHMSEDRRISLSPSSGTSYCV